MLVRFLLVDDDENMLIILRRFLLPVSSFIDSAQTLPEAMEKAETGHFNLIVLDLTLRGTGKEEAFRAVRKLKEKGTGVVVVTGSMDRNVEAEAMAAGADRFVSKNEEDFRRRLLLAVTLAVLHLPKSAFRSESFTDHVKMLQQMAAA